MKFVILTILSLKLDMPRFLFINIIVTRFYHLNHLAIGIFSWRSDFYTQMCNIECGIYTTTANNATSNFFIIQSFLAAVVISHAHYQWKLWSGWWQWVIRVAYINFLRCAICIINYVNAHFKWFSIFVLDKKQWTIFVISYQNQWKKIYFRITQFSALVANYRI